MAMAEDFSLSCPIPISDYPAVQMAHGGAKRLAFTADSQRFRRSFGEDSLPPPASTAKEPG